MSVDMSELARRGQEMRSDGPGTGAPERKTEDTLRMYTDDEKLAVISKGAVKMEIGTPPQEITLYPLSLRQLMVFLPKLKTAMGPLLVLFKDRKTGDPAVPIAQIVDALAEKIDEVPDLVFTLLERGNGNISKEWLMDHFDFVPDMQAIIPVFLRQNGLDKLFPSLSKQ